MDNFFKFSRHKHQRRKKERRVLQRALKAATDPQAFRRVLTAEDWFHCWHQHLDWDGLGDFNPRLRRIFLEGHARLFRHLASQAHMLGKPYQIWITLFADDAGQDAIYLHTPNPHSAFPFDCSDVNWGLPALEEIFSQWLPGFSLVAGRTDGYFIVYAGGFGLPLRQLDTPPKLLIGKL